MGKIFPGVFPRDAKVGLRTRWGQGGKDWGQGRNREKDLREQSGL